MTLGRPTDDDFGRLLTEGFLHQNVRKDTRKDAQKPRKDFRKGFLLIFVDTWKALQNYDLFVEKWSKL